ncbi:hypothetical protein BDF22DRAFT_745078 [Syncephalis plumigaleata]|nr:hypothetical protein BDF22DRAFT_745078 [Syncephalis plumigaleata]
MTAVFIGAGADNCGLNEFEFTYHLLNNDKQHDVCTDLIAKMEKKSNNSNHSSHGVDHLTGQLCELALEQNNDNDNDKSTASTSHMEKPLMSTNTAWRIAPCRRPRAHASSSSLRSLTTPMPDIRRQRAVSAPTPISPNNERSAFINHDKQPHQDTSPSHCNEPVSNLQRKRRLSLDVEVPASVLKRRGAISPLVVPSLECFIRQTRARLDAQATTTTTPSPLIGSPVLSMADDTSCPSTDDEFDHEILL